MRTESLGRETSNFIVAVVVIYGLVFAAVAARGATTNNYDFTGPGLVGLNELWPLPTEWMSDSGAQSIRQLKAAMKHWATNASYGQHTLAGGHTNSFLTPAMVPAFGITRDKFDSNICAQVLGSNGFAQLPMSDVYLQWCSWTNGSHTSCVWNVNWPVPFSNGVWFATCGVVMSATNVYETGLHSTNEWSLARVVNWTATNASGTLNISGTVTTQFTHRISVLGVGRK